MGVRGIKARCALDFTDPSGARCGGCRMPLPAVLRDVTFQGTDDGRVHIFATTTGATMHLCDPAEADAVLTEVARGASEFLRSMQAAG